MKIAIDFRMAQFHREGIVRAALGLVEALKHDHEIHLVLSNPDIRIPEIEQDGNLHLHYIGPKSMKLSLWWENVTLITLLRKLMPRIYCAPFNTGLPYKRIPGIAYVAVLHDIIPRIYPDCIPFSELVRWRISIGATVKNADRIITDSDFSGKDIQRLLGIPGDIIRVQPIYIDDKFKNPNSDRDGINTVKSRYGLQGDYLLYYGGFRKYKNASKVIEVYDRYRSDYSGDLKLCIAGKIAGRFKDNIIPEIQASKYKNDIMLPGFIADDDLPFIVKGAKVLLYLSRYEGFGYVPLEAQACGIPVVCAKNTALLENMADSVLWVGDGDTSDRIAGQIHRMLNDEALRAEWIHLGQSNVQRFSKEKYIRSIMEIFDDAARMENRDGKVL